MIIIRSKGKTDSPPGFKIPEGAQVYVVDDDNAAIRCLREEARRLSDDDPRRECYLILNDMTSLWLMQTIGLPDEIERKVDVLATTAEDLIAKSIFIKLPGVNSPFPALDRVPVTRDSDVTVHLVIIGFSAQTEALAINAALVAHYPNYCRNTRLRTRITIIDENIHDHRDHLTQRYIHLFDNSYYRTIDLNDDNPQISLHRPVYETTRKDFVDVEWEFVCGSVRHDAVRQKLEQWSNDDSRQLTLAVCHDTMSRNTSEAFALPGELYRNGIPVLCYTRDTEVVRVASSSGSFASVIPFGYCDCDILTLSVLRQLAMRVNYVYHHCFSLAPSDPVTAPSMIHPDRLLPLWRRIGSSPKRYSNIFNAMTLGSKIHSVGHDPADWNDYYALTRDEISILAEVEHNRWCVEELLLGFRPLSDSEQLLVDGDISQKSVLRDTEKAHYDLLAYDDLRADTTAKNVRIYDMAIAQSIPLIIKSCITD